MQFIWLIFALELIQAAPNKLSGSYLPPPGIKVADESFEDLDTPLEYTPEMSEPEIVEGNEETYENYIDSAEEYNVKVNDAQNNRFNNSKFVPKVDQTYFMNENNSETPKKDVDSKIYIDQKYLDLIFGKPKQSNSSDIEKEINAMQSDKVHVQTNRIESKFYKRPTTQPEDNKAVTINHQNIQNHNTFANKFDTSNGIHKEEIGTVEEGVKIAGSYSYLGDDGKVYTIKYTADENGFRAYGDHLPTPPPVPEAIQKVLEQARKEKTNGNYDDGSYDDAKYGYMNYESSYIRRQYKMMKTSKNKRKKLIKVQKENSQNMSLSNTQYTDDSVKENKITDGIRPPQINKLRRNEFDDHLRRRPIYVTNEHLKSHTTKKLRQHSSSHNQNILVNIKPNSQYISSNSKENNKHAKVNNDKIEEKPGYLYMAPNIQFIEGQQIPVYIVYKNNFETSDDNNGIPEPIDSLNNVHLFNKTNKNTANLSYKKEITINPSFTAKPHNFNINFDNGKKNTPTTLTVDQIDNDISIGRKYDVSTTPAMTIQKKDTNILTSNSFNGFSVTPIYMESEIATGKVVGEEFFGSKQIPNFDPVTGYKYK